MHLLQNYVKLCRKVNHDFKIENGRYLGKLCLNLQAEIMSKYHKQITGSPK